MSLRWTVLPWHVSHSGHWLTVFSQGGGGYILPIEHFPIASGATPCVSCPSTAARRPSAHWEIQIVSIDPFLCRGGPYPTANHTAQSTTAWLSMVSVSPGSARSGAFTSIEPCRSPLYEVCGPQAMIMSDPQEGATPALFSFPSSEGTSSLLPSLNQAVPSFGSPWMWHRRPAIGENPGGIVPASCIYGNDLWAMYMAGYSDRGTLGVWACRGHSLSDDSSSYNSGTTHRAMGTWAPSCFNKVSDGRHRLGHWVGCQLM